MEFDEDEEFEVMGNTIKDLYYEDTYFRIENDTDIDIIDTKATNFDTYDWKPGRRPDQKLNGLTIKNHDTDTTYFPSTKYAHGCPFTLTLKFQDKTKVVVRIYQEEARLLSKSFRPPTHRSEALETSGYNVSIYVKGSKTIVNIRLSKYQVEETRAKKITKEGEQALRNNYLQVALRKFEEAAALANASETRTQIAHNLVETRTKIARRLLEKALFIETSGGNPEEASQLLLDAKQNLEKSAELGNSKQTRQKLQFVTLKIEGNLAFNKALELEEEALSSLETALESNETEFFTATAKKYSEALNLYKEALKKYEEAQKLNEANVQKQIDLILTQIEELRESEDHMVRLYLAHNIKNISVEHSDVTKQQTTSQTYQEQIDVLL